MGEVHFPSPQIDGRQYVARRAAQAMLRSNGATEVSLRITEPNGGTTADQLGITLPSVEDVPLSPAVVRPVSGPNESKQRYEVLIGYESLEQAIGNYGIDDVATWLLTSVALIYGKRMLHVDTVIVDHYAGAEFLYRVLASE